MPTSDKRIQILSKSEIKELYDLPVFNHSDREDYFSLDKETLRMRKPRIGPNPETQKTTQRKGNEAR